MSIDLKNLLNEFQFVVPEAKSGDIIIVANDSTVNEIRGVGYEYSKFLTVLDKSTGIEATHALQGIGNLTHFVVTEKVEGVSVRSGYALEQPIENWRIGKVDIKDCILKAKAKDAIEFKGVDCDFESPDGKYNLTVSQSFSPQERLGRVKGPIKLAINTRGEMANSPFELEYDPSKDIYTFSGGNNWKHRRNFHGTGAGKKRISYFVNAAYGFPRADSNGEALFVRGCILGKDELLKFDPWPSSSLIDAYYHGKLPEGLKEAESLVFLHADPKQFLFTAVKKSGMIKMSYRGENKDDLETSIPASNGDFSQKEIEQITQYIQSIKREGMEAMEAKFIEKIYEELMIYTYIRRADKAVKRGMEFNLDQPFLLSCNTIEAIELGIRTSGAEKMLRLMDKFYKVFAPDVNKTTVLRFER